MRFLSLFSGIEAASVAWLPLGWECAAVAEVDPAACSVLSHHYPEVPNLGDVTKVTRARIEALGRLDLVIFGSPCQDLSIAGKREGLKGDRSGLFFDAMRIVRWSGARFALFENVPGLFSSHDGRDFAAVVREMVGLDIDVPGDGWRNTGVALGERGLLEWAVLDAQWFGVPQRRRRIFALADFGDWTSRPPILPQSESLSGHPPPSRKTGQGFTHELAPSLTSSVCGVERAADSRGQDCVIPILEAGARTGKSTDDVRAGSGIGEYGDPMLTLQSGKQHGIFASTGHTSHCLNAGGMGRIDYETETLVTQAFDWQTGGDMRGIEPKDTAQLQCGQVPAIISPVFPETAHALRADGFDASEDGTGRGTPLVAHTLGIRNAKGTDERGDGSSNLQAVGSSAVRRLTPVECMRLQNFPDDYFAGVLHRGKPLADGPIYKMLGNSMCTSVVRWIGERIEAASLIP